MVPCVHRGTNHPRQRPENGGRGSATIEARFPVAAHARGHNLEFRASVQRRLVQGLGTTSSGRALRKTGVPRRSYSTSSSYYHPRQRPENGGRGSATIEARFPVAAHARGHNLEFRASVQRRLVQGLGTTSSGRALRKTGVPRRSYSTSSSYSSSSSSMFMEWWSPIDQRATIRMMLHLTYQSPS